MGFAQLLEKVVSFIKDSQTSRENVGKAIRTLNGKQLQAVEAGEQQLAYGLQKPLLQGKFAGVDSGFISQSFYALDLMMIRSAGVCFEYEKGKVARSNYFPNSFGPPEPIVNTDGLEKDEFHKFVSLTRLQAEANNAAALIREHKPHVLFIDGSLIPMPADKPGSDSKLKKEYHQTIEAFQYLYAAAREHDCLLIGTIEDSRSERLKELLKEKILPKHELQLDGMNSLQDASILDKTLNAGERSFAFTYAADTHKHAILMDFPFPIASQLHACYVKPSQWDYPIRCEFFSNAENLTITATRVGEYVYAQSSLHKEYAFPSVLIEADLRAGLKPEEIEMVSDKIFSKVGRHTIHLRRRDRRPF
ncbi:MAG: DNA double-strand break repair nuclease NurA [Candidatus Iainarchaeum archaeon]|uniref:DNA double-strand break repair nuclease NurA n=1 Tax=Candidatus Iainarchaeum sp. TaxID=3101447 RepID=A0A7T9DJY1_9ARCH|nr:MAG: DNA double-strand break repair nuclease NurA [Candidatus Diapherotrites archaeon]